MGCGAFHCKECQRLASEVTSCIYLVLLWLAFHLWNFMALFIFGLAFNLCSSWLGHYFNMPTWVTEGILAVPCNFVNLLFLFYSKNFKCWFSICYPLFTKESAFMCVTETSFSKLIQPSVMFNKKCYNLLFQLLEC